MLKVNFKLKGCILAILCLSIMLFNGCTWPKTKPEKPNNTNIKENWLKKKKTKEDKPAARKEESSTKEDKTKDVPPSTQGSGYLSEGSTIGLGIVDGDEELKVLKKVKRLEARLEALRNKMSIQEETSNKKLSDLQTAKEEVEKEFADTKKILEEINKNLSEENKSLESKLRAAETRAIAAEQELNPIKKELYKSQISETKAQQELYKLKIDNLKQDEE